MLLISRPSHACGSPAKKSKPGKEPGLFEKDPTEVNKKRKKKKGETKFTLLQPSKMITFDLAEDFKNAEAEKARQFQSWLTRGPNFASRGKEDWISKFSVFRQ